MSDFNDGAKAVFDYLLDAAANTDDDEKADILCEYAEDALEYASPDTCQKWRDIQYMHAENHELRKANADKFGQIEALKKQVNDLQNEINRSAHSMLTDVYKREKWVYIGTDAMFRDESDRNLKETQAAAQRILEDK